MLFWYKKNRLQLVQQFYRCALFSIVLIIAYGLTPAFAQAASHSASKTVLVLGDSLSAEYGLARGTGWVALMEHRLQEKKIAANVINASISGETTSGGKARLEKLLSQYQPDIVIIELGGNDALRGLALSASETNFRDMVAMSSAAKAKVLLVGMQIPPNYGRDYTERFFSIYGKIAKESKTALVPFLLQGVADKPQLFQPDRIHLIADAHPMMLDNVWLHLYPLLISSAK
ncbi:arylesterase [Undibacterium sp. Rencai35W]|uniref:arylesterase n=1 Tax=Undibacterium sp. Rencai35W TaxID=3413046 RepID=UPI003BF08546